MHILFDGVENLAGNMQNLYIPRDVFQKTFFLNVVNARVCAIGVYILASSPKRIDRISKPVAWKEYSAEKVS